MIVYYSGTGNSRIIAEKIAEVTGDEITDSFGAIRSGKYPPYASAKPWVFVSPTHAWRIPKIFEDFIRLSAFYGSRDAYFVMTCGADIGNAKRYLRSLCEDKGFNFRGVRQINMPENYTAMFPVPDEAETEKIIAAALPLAEETAGIIMSGGDIPPRRFSGADWMKSGFINECFKMFCVGSKGFRLTDGCIGCGKCESLCPTGCISMKDGRPSWGKDCMHCMACINACPAFAIEYKNISVGKPRIYGGSARVKQEILP